MENPTRSKCGSPDKSPVISIPHPWINLKYVGACVKRVKSPQIPPHCATALIQTTFEVKIAFHGTFRFVSLLRMTEEPRVFKMYSFSFG